MGEGREEGRERGRDRDRDRDAEGEERKAKKREVGGVSPFKETG